jgi:hypothetical protein
MSKSNIEKERETILKILSSEERAVFELMYDLKDLTYREIDVVAKQLNITLERAEELERSVGAIWQNIFPSPINFLSPEEEEVFKFMYNKDLKDIEKSIDVVAEKFVISPERAKELILSTKHKLDKKRELSLDILSPEEKAVMELRYGLKDGIFRNIEVAAEQLEITIEKTKELEFIAINKLRNDSKGESTISQLGPHSEYAKDIQKCSFCGVNQHMVNKLVSGPGVNICDECIAFLNEILEKSPLSNNSLSDKRKCSFCGTSLVRRLFAGPGVYICFECLECCNRALKDVHCLPNQVFPYQLPDGL